MNNSVKLKIVLSIIFAILVGGCYVFLLLRDDFSPPFVSLGAVVLCFIFSLLFFKFETKKFFLTLALGVYVVAETFLVFQNSSYQDTLIGTLLLCGAQLCLLIFTLTLNSGSGLKVINLALRVALCVIAYFLLPKYFVLDTVQIISILCMINILVTLIWLLFDLKAQWLTFLAVLLLLAGSAFSWLSSGGAEAIGITGEFLTTLQTLPLGFYFHFPSLFLLSLSSVWAKKIEK